MMKQFLDLNHIKNRSYLNLPKKLRVKLTKEKYENDFRLAEEKGEKTKLFGTPAEAE